MSDEVGIDIVSSIDLRDLESRLTGEVLRVFEDNGREMKAAIFKRWRGWKYKGRDMRTIGRSSAGWGYEVQATTGRRELILFNNARGYYTNKPYAAYVARRKGQTPEWLIMRDMLIREQLPKMIKEVTEALAKGMQHGPAKRVRENKQTSYTRLSIEG